MATYKNINKSTNVVSVGRTAPVPRGVQSKNNSLPVVLASDADPVPVVEQNKIQSEVALSLLGIPRSEVALGIFADVNTYDVNPSEWSINPIDRSTFDKSTFDRPFDYSEATASTTFQHGLSHIPEEAGALVEAPPGKSAVLTSKRFFRYQPGRVSAATFGVKESVVDHVNDGDPSSPNRNPAIRKFGIYDNFDGYYWETRDTGKGDQFGVTRRTQSIIDERRAPTEFSMTTQQEDYGIVGKGNSTELVCTMTADTALSTNGTTLTVPVANINAAPEIGMTIRNISHESDGTNTLVVNSDDCPLFAETTVVTNVATVGSNYSISLNQSVTGSSLYSPTKADNFSAKRLKFTRAGELAIVRDGILMTQAGIYDPTLLKNETLNEIASVSGHDIKFDSPGSGQADSPGGLIAHRAFEFGQLVEYTTDATTANITADNDITGATGKSLRSSSSPTIFMISQINVSKNTIRLRELPSIASDSPKEFRPHPTSAANFSTTKHFIKTPVPFIFPEIISETTGGVSNTSNVRDIMFPYSRSFDLTRTAIGGDFQDHKGTTGTAGLIDTDISGASADRDETKFNNFKADINDLNRGLTACTMKSYTRGDSTRKKSSAAKIVSGWRYWIQNNVKPDFYGVYEYKIPRSRFSHESLDGKTGSAIVYSDIVKDGGSTKFPGQAVAGDVTTRDSLWDIDFSKVIMKKIEFSWYGAVGALFLAYVPVSNGEARWVRVHHLRASNQLKVASLGNATLPLTYTVFGGGTPKQLGAASFRTAGYSGGKSLSEFVTKYGSSYYIDGGDRGTVRLFNFAPAAPTSLKTSSIPLTLKNFTTPTNTKKFKFSYSPTGTGLDIGPTDLLIGGVLKNNAGATAKITYVERKGSADTPYTATMHVNKVISNTTGAGSAGVGMRVTVEPGINLYGIESKTEIQSSQEFKVRNRVQVYPTKLSAGMVTAGGQTENVSLRLKKNVKFQTDEVFKIKYNKGSGLVARDGSFFSPNATNMSGSPNVQDGWRFKNDCPLAGSGLPTRLFTGTAGVTAIGNYTPRGAGLTVGGPEDCPSIALGTEFFGHALVKDSLNNEFPLFAKIKKVDVDSSNKNVFDFIPLEPYTGVTKFVAGSSFTYSMQYRNAPTNDASAKTYLLQSARTADTEEIERLSSVTINNETIRSIPNTGTSIAQFFLEDGSDLFDLSSYFDYNKDYISFPLTNVPDNLFLEAKIDSPKEVTSTGQINPKVVASFTWEEQ